MKLQWIIITFTFVKEIVLKILIVGATECLKEHFWIYIIPYLEEISKPITGVSIFLLPPHPIHVIPSIVTISKSINSKRPPLAQNMVRLLCPIIEMFLIPCKGGVNKIVEDNVITLSVI